ncbi:MAG TPA: hypothetical protein VJN68_10810 [Burkholderiaceae bacterium]|nr:hypothetical protein [Burkholderiaceae bacterium]
MPRSGTRSGWLTRLGLAGLGLIAACSSPTPAPESTAPAGGRTAPSAAIARGAVKLPPPGPVRNWNELRRQAAERMVAANPGITYKGAPPDPLLAIPVLEVELNADGSVRRIDVMRHPRQAKETTQIAIDAVRNAAPFGDVSRLPKPWRFTETFLFDDDRRFKPRTLD